MTISTDRRSLLALPLLAAAGGALAQTAPGTAGVRPLLTARPEPVVGARFPSEIAPGVFILPDRRIPLVPNVGIVVGRDSVLVIDCGLGIGSSEAVLDVARRLAPRRRIVLTVTHAHPEHGFGAQVFARDADIVYNALQRDYLRRAGPTLLAGFRASVLPPAHRHLLDGITLTPAERVYDGPPTTIDLGGRTVTMRTWGTAHTPGDQIVHLPQEGIVFAGDLVEERMFPIVPFFPPMIARQDIDLARWRRVLADIGRLAPRIVVPGHGNLGGTEIVAAVGTYLATIQSLAASPAATVESAHAAIAGRYPTWENPEFIDPALRYLMT